jgi:hypothetical protein
MSRNSVSPTVATGIAGKKQSTITWKSLGIAAKEHKERKNRKRVQHDGYAKIIGVNSCAFAVDDSER